MLPSGQTIFDYRKFSMYVSATRIKTTFGQLFKRFFFTVSIVFLSALQHG